MASFPTRRFGGKHTMKTIRYSPSSGYQLGYVRSDNELLRRAIIRAAALLVIGAAIGAAVTLLAQEAMR